MRRVHSGGGLPHFCGCDSLMVPFAQLGYYPRTRSQFPKTRATLTPLASDFRRSYVQWVRRALGQPPRFLSWLCHLLAM